MKNSFFNSDYVLPLALSLSAGIHVALIAATGTTPFNTDAAVLNAPNSPEITVIAQPLVSVLEEEITSEELDLPAPVEEEIILSNVEQNAQSKPSAPTQESSREVRGAVTEAKPLMQVNPAPLYPKIARQKGWEGTVKLSATIEEDGMPYQVSVSQSSGYRILDKAAVDTVKTWKFTPAQSGSSRFSSKITIPIRFDLIRNP